MTAARKPYVWPLAALLDTYGSYAVAMVHRQGVRLLLFEMGELQTSDEYVGEAHSHACASRRMADVVGVDKMLLVGVRSMCKEEMLDAREMGLRWVTAKEAREMTAEAVLSRLMGGDVQHLYLSIDVDGIDPAYAPGTGTPEPFGLDVELVKSLIQASAPFLVGLDVVEVCPPVDNGNTALLAARLIREAIAVTWKEKGMPQRRLVSRRLEGMRRQLLNLQND